ncbi:hypothetical protein HDU98_008228 [Podochytrium sp. JEL0797]|nr:hypothetical protein HDU98_008228 [Podochytrium sp. JEL0797]
MTKPELLKLTPDAFAALLLKNNIEAFHIVTRNGRIEASHALLQPIADYFAREATDYEGHEAVFVQVGKASKTLQSATIHRTCRAAGAGGVRNWIYDDMESFFRDGLRLSKGMTLKNALAGLWWGGGKGLIARNSGTGLSPTDTFESRKIVFEEYGSFLSQLKGCFVTAGDVGVTSQDIVHLYSKSRFVTGIPAEMGGSGVPAIPTARGIAVALEAAFDHLGMNIHGSKIAIQGVGAVGTRLIEDLFALGVGSIVGTVLNPDRKASIYKQFELFGDRLKLRVVDKADPSILFEDVDAVCPCATGGILNPSTIPQIRAKIVCGAANNQLLDPSSDAKLLLDRGILYVPDFVCNRMGIVNCADEHLGTMENDRKIEIHLGRDWDDSIYNVTRKVLADSETSGKTSQEISIALADEKSCVPNPLYGHRGIAIINSLVENDKVWRNRVGMAANN